MLSCPVGFSSPYAVPCPSSTHCLRDFPFSHTESNFCSPSRNPSQKGINKNNQKQKQKKTPKTPRSYYTSLKRTSFPFVPRLLISLLKYPPPGLCGCCCCCCCCLMASRLGSVDAPESCSCSPSFLAMALFPLSVDGGARGSESFVGLGQVADCRRCEE